MIANFFQSLKRENVSYLLISGQATVLYGAASFSEDVDIWIKPSQENADALLRALSVLGASYYKLTPPLQAEYILRGHGFHFCIPGTQEFYLDVMGHVPRVSGFDEALSDSRIINTSWGDIPTVGIKRLVAIKTTQRLSDYPIIGRLTLRYMTEKTSPGDADYEWALENVHTVEDLEELALSYPPVQSVAAEQSELRNFVTELAQHGETAQNSRREAEQWLTERMLKYRELDRIYWREIIAELKELRSNKKLMPVGQAVTHKEK